MNRTLRFVLLALLVYVLMVSLYQCSRGVVSGGPRPWWWWGRSYRNEIYIAPGRDRSRETRRDRRSAPAPRGAFGGFRGGGPGSGK
jgi:hypothetical protein